MSAEDVTRAPTHLGTERCDRLHKQTGLDGNVQIAIDVHALERLLRPEVCTARHKARRLVLGKSELLECSEHLCTTWLPQVRELPGGLPPPGRGRHPV